MFFLSSGRLSPKPFAIGAGIVYAIAFLSQFLLAAPLLARGGALAFVAVQSAVTWAWYALHAKRLRDTARPAAPAGAIAVLYALSIMLFLLVVAAAGGQAPSIALTESRPAGLLEIFLIPVLVAAIISDPHPGMFQYLLLGSLVLVMLPFLIALIFSIWLATKASAPAVQ